MIAYNPGAPQPPDIPADSQDDFLTNFELINQFFGMDHIPFGNTVTFATNANPCVCTSPSHGLTTGNTVNIVHFGSLVGDVISLWNINGGPYTATVIDANTFSINANATANPPYFANSGAFSSPNFNYGFHKKNFFPNTLQQGPNTTPPLGAPYSAYHTKTVKNLAQLFFQNGPGSSFEQQLTSLNVIEVSNANGRGVITPWGVKLNFGPIVYRPTTQIYTLPAPFTTTFMGVFGTILAPRVQAYTSRMNAVGLTQFSASVQYPFSIPVPTVPGFYFAIGV